MPDNVGRCPQCKGILTHMQDQEGRHWFVCRDCGAQFPLEQGRVIVGEQSDKAAENSFAGIQ